MTLQDLSASNIVQLGTRHALYVGTFNIEWALEKMDRAALKWSLAFRRAVESLWFDDDPPTWRFKLQRRPYNWEVYGI